jgi:hypothetical protein
MANLLDSIVNVPDVLPLTDGSTASISSFLLRIAMWIERSFLYRGIDHKPSTDMRITSTHPTRLTITVNVVKLLLFIYFIILRK